MEEMTIRPASMVDFDVITHLLKEADLFSQDVLAVGTRYWVVEDRDEKVVGCLGMELGKEAVLLKSAAVKPAFRKKGLAERLVQEAVSFAVAHGYQRAYLFSVRSGGYWQRLGFREVPVAELVEALQDAYQVRHFQRIGKLPTEHAWKHEL